MIGDRLRTLLWVNRIRLSEGQGTILYFPPNRIPLEGSLGRATTCPVAKTLPGREADVWERGYSYIPWGATLMITGKTPKYVRRFIRKLDQSIGMPLDDPLAEPA